MKPTIFFSTLMLTSLLLLTAVQAQSQAGKKQQLYIGIEKNRLPYTDLDDQQQAQGILVTAIIQLCETINAECKFIVGEFNQLLEEVRTFQLHGLLVIDSFILPEIEKLKLIPPLCKIQPVFIYKQDDNGRRAQEDFKGATIGVRKESLLHLYLLDEYSSDARLKPFELLESGVFDLVTGRIDVLSADQAFFVDRVQRTPFGNEYVITRMEALQPDGVVLPPVSMTLALRQQDTDLHEALTVAIESKGQPSFCSDLLVGQQQAEVSIHPPSINVDTPTLVVDKQIPKN